MAPIKFEENIREKLEERELQPSKRAWDKLSAQLDNASEKKTNNVFWYAIAASFIGVLIVASVFFTQRTIPSEENIELVTENTDSKESIDEVIEDDEIPNFSEVNINKQEAIVETNTQESSSEKSVKTITQRSTSIPATAANGTPENALNTTLIAKNNTDSIIDRSKLSQEDVIFNNKVDEVVAQVKLLQNTKAIVTSEEIDVLLQSAQKEIVNQRILASKKVDATALLMDVEFELERGFRDKVFEALGDGFEKIRTAVVERNN